MGSSSNSSSGITSGGGGGASPPALPTRNRWKRLAVLIGIPVVAALLLLVIFWNIFFHYVPPGQMLVVISKGGDPLPEGEVLAEAGQKGIQKQVLGEGWHFVLPIVYSTERKPNVVINPGEVGIVTALGGKIPPGGGELAQDETQRGIRRNALLPGSYRLNPYGYKVETAKMVTILPGYVGVKRRLLGKESAGAKFAVGPEEKGIINEVLQPGIYPINTREYEIIPCEVGIYQTTYHYDREPRLNTALKFQAQDSYTVSMDCTIEWELEPANWPDWVTRFRDRETIDKQVVRLHAEQIAQVSGNRFGAQDFLEGAKREKFQEDFREELKRKCGLDKVIVKHAYIRNIIIPESYLEQKRQEQLAVETKLTKEALGMTAQSEAEVVEAKQTVELKVREVAAETARKVALLEREAENVKVLTEAEVEKLQAEYANRIADLESKRKTVAGEAEAEAKKMKETAKSGLYKLKMGVFGQNSDAFLRYTMAQELSPKMQLRLFQSGPGTLWTNMGNKNMNFMLPLAGADQKASPGDGKSSPGTKAGKE